MDGANAYDNPFRRNTPLLFLIGFAAVIFIGATLLNLPFATADGNSIGFVNALFTATSAVCVTGLAVVTTSTYWTLFGKIVILVLIQIGGLGIMTLTTIIPLFLGKKISLRTRLLIQEERNSSELQGVVKVTRNVLIYTFTVEIVGAMIFSLVFCKEYGIITGICFSIFHSVSAFCNAGFDLIGSSSFMKYVDNPIITLCTAMLIILGGIGYIVFIDIASKRRFNTLSLHTKIVLVITAILIVTGTVLFMVFEYTNVNTIGELDISGKIQASFFQSVTARTAGFCTVDMASLRNATVLMMMILMFIGGSSGSTAGGIKVTTFSVVVLAVWGNVCGKRDVEIYQKKIPFTLVMKAVSVLIIALTVVLSVTVLLSVSEMENGFAFKDLVFEAVSAFGTVGLSRNLTGSLNSLSKIILSCTMFIGRLGPLTVATAMFSGHGKKKGNYTYPDGKIMIG